MSSSQFAFAFAFEFDWLQARPTHSEAGASWLKLHDKRPARLIVGSISSTAYNPLYSSVCTSSIGTRVFLLPPICCATQSPKRVSIVTAENQRLSNSFSSDADEIGITTVRSTRWLDWIPNQNHDRLMRKRDRWWRRFVHFLLHVPEVVVGCLVTLPVFEGL